MNIFGDFFKETYTDRQKKRLHRIFQVDDRRGREDDDYSLQRCINCEEWFDERSGGQGNEHPHGKWISESSHWRKKSRR